MHPTAEGNLLRRYWRTYLPGWLIPFPVLGASLLVELAPAGVTESVLPFVVLAIIVHITYAEILGMRPWRRGELGLNDGGILVVPFVAAALICFFLYHVLVQFFRS